jgi:hypothetical protein
LRALQVLDRSAAARGVVQSVSCPPEDRTVAVIVRTDGRVGLPIQWQGREVTRTDAAGVAAMTFRMRPASQLQLAMITDTQPALRPQNPPQQWMVPDNDEVFVWDQSFHEEGHRGSVHVRHVNTGVSRGSSGSSSGGNGEHVIHHIQHTGPTRQF